MNKAELRAPPFVAGGGAILSIPAGKTRAKMPIKTFYKKLQYDLGTIELHDLLLQMGERNLTIEEQSKIDEWVKRFESRRSLFKMYQKILAYQTRLVTADHAGLVTIWKELTVDFPAHFKEVNTPLTHFVLRQTITQNLELLGWKVSYDMVFAKKLITVIGYSIRLIILILVVIITLQLLRYYV